MLNSFIKAAKIFSSLKVPVELLRTMAASLRSDYRMLSSLLIQPQKIENYLKSHKIKKLQLGSGANFLQGWLNTDLQPVSEKFVFVDAAKPFAFNNKSFDYIFSEHLIEHLPYHLAIAMLKECYRILKPGGRIRIATPSLDNLIGLFSGQKHGQKRYIKWVVGKYFPEALSCQTSFAINNIFYGFGHKFIYDYSTLQTLLEQTGFGNILSHAPGQSGDENFHNIEGHSKIIGNEFNCIETLVLEATRP